ELAEQGLVVLVPATAHRRFYRDQVRARAGRFIEVWMMASLDECRERDTKGLYTGYAAGRIQNVPGEDLAYEQPELPEVSARGGDDDQALLRILQCLSKPSAARQA
ncbi:MAG TPA: adenylyl-sulfate kinase, partial [Polyangiaceae bacterium]